MQRVYLTTLIMLLLLTFAASLIAFDVTVGSGNQQNRKPFDFYYRYSLFETIYYPEEMLASGYITAISFYNSFPQSAYTNGHIQIWLSNTGLQDLSAGWVPSTQLTMVQNTSINFPSGQNEILINLSSPFLYTGGNLILLARTPGNTTWTGEPMSFFCQTSGTNRARDFYSNQNNADHANPPMTGTNLNLSGQFPKTTFHFSNALPVTDLGFVSFDGPESMTAGQTYTYNAIIQNFGYGTQSQYTVKLYGWNDIELASVAGVSLDSGYAMEVPLVWTPLNEGYTSIYARLFMAGDQNQFNNATEPLAVVILPEGGGTIVNQGSLSGKVINGQDEPVAFASVHLNVANLETNTDADGNYSFAWLDSGTLQATVSAPGYVTQTQSVNIVSGQNNQADFTLHLVADLTITGRVVASDFPDSGIPAATVEIIGAVTTAVATDASGYFTIYDVIANQDYTIRASHPSYFTYYGDVTLQSQNLDMGDLVLGMDTTSADDQTAEINLVLHNCYPNPFRTQTAISYEVKAPVRTVLEVFNLKGQKVATLASSFSQAGKHTLVWNGTDCTGKPVASGVYYYRLQAGTYSATRKLVLLR
jgi:hypothetical protein